MAKTAVDRRPSSRFGYAASLSTPITLAIAVVAAATVATIIDTVIAAIAHAAGASHSFAPLQFPAYTSLTVIGLLVAGLTWTIIRARATNPGALLAKLVPIVIALSFIPDLAVGITKSQPHTSWGAIVALMLMHFVVAGSGVTAFSTLLPIARARRG